MNEKQKLITILICFVLLLLLSGAAVYKGTGKGSASPVTSADDLKGRRLGGIEGRMPANSAKIFFESMLGRKLSGYNAYGSVDEALYALNSGRVSAVALTDVTAEYIAATKEGYSVLDTSDMAAIQNMELPRFEFGMAAANNKDGEKLIKEINSAINILKEDGTLAELADICLYGEDGLEEFLEAVRDEYRGRFINAGIGRITVGVTGNTPPIDMTDSDNEPVGYSKALCELIGMITGYDVKLLVLDSDTIFSGLMSGRIDLVFAYGAGRITTEGSKDWIMSEGYLPMQKYEFLVLEAEE